MIGPDNSPIKIVLLDNHTLTRAGLRLIIDNQPGMRVVGESGSLNEGQEIVAANNPDIILLEMNLPAELESNIVDSLIKASKNARLILVTGISDPAVIHKAVDNGVMGVVFKTQPPDILIKAIQKVNEGEVWIERSMIANVLFQRTRNNSEQKPNTEKNSIELLSQREIEVIRLIGQGYKNKKISSQLCISETTVRHHLTSIYGKLGVSDRLELLVYAHKNGLVKPTGK